MNLLRKQTLKEYIPLILLGGLLVLCSVFWPIGLFPFIHDSSKFYCSIFVVGSLLVLQFKYHKGPIGLNLYDYCFLAFILWAFLSLFWATNKTQVLVHYSIWTLMYVLFRSLYKNESIKINPKWGTTIILLTCLVNYLIWIWFSIDISIQNNNLPFSYANLESVKSYFNYNGNYLSACLVMLTPVYFLAKNHYFVKRKWIWLLFVFHLFTLISLNSRGSLITFIIIVLIYMIDNFSFYRKRAKESILGIVVFIGLTILILVGAQKNMEFFVQMNPLRQINSEVGDDRIKLWRKSATLIQENPLLGVGGGNWKIIYPKTNLSDLRYNYDQRNYLGHPHNYYLHIFSELGIVGFILFCLIIGSGLILIFSKFVNKSPILKFAFSIIIAFLIFSFFYGVHYHKTYLFSVQMHYLFVAIAILLSNKNVKPLKEIHLSKTIYFSFLFLLLFSFTSWKIYYDYQSQQYKKVGILAMAGETKQAIQLLQDIHHPFLFSNYGAKILKVEEGILWTKEQEFQKAYQTIKEGLKENPYNLNAWWSLAEAYRKDNKLVEAKEAYHKILEINSTYQKAKIRLAQINLKERDWENFDKNLSFYETKIVPVQSADFLEQISDNENPTLIEFHEQICRYEDQILQLKSKAEKYKSYQKFKKNEK